MKTKKTTLLQFIPPIAGIVLLISWFYLSEKPFDAIGYIILGVSLFLIGLGIHFKVKRYQNVKIGLPAEDEFSTRIREKAAAKAFYWSFYLWLFVVLFVIEAQPKIKIILGLGLLAMGLIFFVGWLYYNRFGFSNENKN